MESEKENVFWNEVAKKENQRDGELEQKEYEEAGKHGRMEKMSRQAVNGWSCLLPSSSQKMPLWKLKLFLGGLNLLLSPGLCTAVVSLCQLVVTIFSGEFDTNVMKSGNKTFPYAIY